MEHFAIRGIFFSRQGGRIVIIMGSAVIKHPGPVRIESATWRDLKPLHGLEKNCFGEDAWPLLELLGVLTFPDIVRLKAVVDGQMAGFIAGDRRRSEGGNRLHAGVGWILTLGVLPEWRREGIAEMLLADCEKALALPVIKLTVRRGNLPAIALYRKMGYQQSDIWSKYYHNGEDGLVFKKQLEGEDALA